MTHVVTVECTVAAGVHQPVHAATVWREVSATGR
jgi:hypothetical protein